MRILILGVNGMLGHIAYTYFSQDPNFDVWGTCRSKALLTLKSTPTNRVFEGIEIRDRDQLIEIIATCNPEVIINCIGLIKQRSNADHIPDALEINALFPHHLQRICQLSKSRLIHVSTDCVFDGRTGSYTEEDLSNAEDIYGRTKFLGEVRGTNTITLRTSIIGHELQSKTSLLEWFLSQSGPIKGFKKAMFSGVPTAELCRIIHKYVLPNTDLEGLYHIAAEPISKFDLLKLIAKEYNHNIEILPDDNFEIDRTLNATKFNSEAGYHPPSWKSLITQMRQLK